eukprot:258289-Chlamydomonas_euryale.AAC.2
MPAADCSYHGLGLLLPWFRTDLTMDCSYHALRAHMGCADAALRPLSERRVLVRTAASASDMPEWPE